jgi:hypothetical protein
MAPSPATTDAFARSQGFVDAEELEACYAASLDSLGEGDGDETADADRAAYAASIAGRKEVGGE